MALGGVVDQTFRMVEAFVCETVSSIGAVEARIMNGYP